MKQMNIKKKYLIEGNQFYEVSIPNAYAVIWEDDKVVCMPILRVDEEYRSQGIGKKLFQELEKYAQKQGKIFQVSDVPKSLVAMRKIMKGYEKQEFTKDNYGKEDTIAMYRKENVKFYNLKELVKKHLLIYKYFKLEPEVKLNRCPICLNNFPESHYICPHCGLCMRCQCISFSKTHCHLCNNGAKEAKKNYKCKTRIFYY